jgi:hypothetical protein
MAHSTRTWSRPRIRNWRNPRALLDLAEHWLGELLAQPVGAFMSAGLDLRAHGRNTRRRFDRRSGGLVHGHAGNSISGNSVSGPAGRHIAIDGAGFQRREIGLRAVARID